MSWSITTAVCLVIIWGVGIAPVHGQERPTAPVDTSEATAAPDTTWQPPDVAPVEPLAPLVRDTVVSIERVLAAREANEAEQATPIDTALVRRYVPVRRERSYDLFPRTSPLFGPLSTSRGSVVTLDSTDNSYFLDGAPRARGPMRLEAETYRRERYRANIRDNWQTIASQQQDESGSQGLGVDMVVPGGRTSAFSTVFGKPQVELRMNGQADINAGFNYRKSDQSLELGNATQIDPSFKQDLRLGITGTVGDKLQINVDWDTNSQFDFQNQVKLDYTGYEDEIVQNVEAGNVSMQTPSQLINGGQSLFGIKSQFQLGNLSLTTIASQQEGQSNSLNIEGGSKKSEFDLQPTEYDEGQHYFLGYYFRNNWNRAHQDPTRVSTFDGFDQITEIEVWKLRTSRGDGESNVRDAVAVVDLGEEVTLLDRTDAYTEAVLPSVERDQYAGGDVDSLRDGNVSVSTYVSTAAKMERTLGNQDWVEGDFQRLRRGRDYRLDERLGFLSLQQSLRPGEALAVAFRYRTNDGTVRTIGDFAGDQGGSSGGAGAGRLLLKLLRPSNPVAPSEDGSVNPAAWFLEMRNVYELDGRDFQSGNFELDIEYEPSGSRAQTTIPEIAGQTPLLQVLGLDRVDESGAQNPDNQFDFNQQTINTEEGLIYFPYLEPFGERILDVAEENGNRSAGEPFAFETLYTQKKTNAEKEKGKNVYYLRGSYTGSVQDFYDLEAFAGLVEGSVEVTSGGQTLQEGTDYRVDYQSGTVTITNPSYLTAGRDIHISYEQQSLSDLQKKTLLGARADWSLRDQVSVGATVMRLSEKSPVDKFQVGGEPIKNTIWGLNGSMDLQPRWLTQAVDALPLIQTRAQSRVSVSGEFAQLRPGHTTTEAFEQTVQDVEQSETDSYAADERNGVSYIDDFEGFENTFSLREQLGEWQVSAAPDSIGQAPGLNEDVPGVNDDQARTHWRGSFGWYRINEQILEQLEGSYTQRGDPEAVEVLDIQEVFDRDTRGEANPTLRTLDIYFDPWERGAYNYTPKLEDFFREPTQVWGGMTRQLPEGYTDFSVQNVEFVEFIVKVYPQNGQISDDARLYVDLGTISEDVVPNQELNKEDGLALDFNEEDLGLLSRTFGSGEDGNIDLQGGKTEDLGLDGLVSYTDGPYDQRLLERNFYTDFMEQADSLQSALGQLGLTSAQQQRLRAELSRSLEDPSADDYHYYENDNYYSSDDFFPGGVTLQQRFSRYNAGHELNGFETQNALAEDVSIRRGASRSPDTENLDQTGGNVNLTNDYFQYAIPLDELDERAQSDQGPTDYVVSKVGEEKDWYKVRIPVRNFTRKVGNIENFSRIESMRMWTTGHAAPVTMRFASLELVGSQWRTSEAVAQQPVENDSSLTAGTGELRVASINDEEDPEYEPPVGAVVSRNRTARGVQQQGREQALQLSVDELGPGQQRGIFKNVQGLNLLKYSNLRMYTHVHGGSSSPAEKEEIRENLRMFVRIGASETGDYYEYSQKLTPSDVPGASDAKSPWPRENEMNLLLGALNQLKTARGQTGVRTNTTFTSEDADLSLDFVPPESEAIIKIHGTPSLSDVQTLVIGVRHAGDPATSPMPPVLRDLELWVNELRVSGYDERKGWAANANANVELADLATIQGSFQRQTDGFGGLSSTLGNRRQADNTSWNLRSDLNLDALLPEQQGWSIPVTMQIQSSQTVPRFDPNRGDVRVEEVASLFDSPSAGGLPDTTIQNEYSHRYPGESVESIRQLLKDSVRTAAQTYNLRRTMTANLSKQGSDSWWLQKTVDATSLSFSYLDRTARTPQRRINDQWNWSGSFDYQLQFGQARAIEPFWFLPDVPLLGSLADLSFNYVPRSLSFTSSAERDVTTTRSRASGNQANQEIPYRVAYPLREQQQFSHRRTFGFQYDPFEFLSLSFDTNTQQNLNDIASRSETNVIIQDHPVLSDRVVTDVGIDADNPDAFFENPSAYLGDVPSDTAVTSADLGRSIFFEEKTFQRSELSVLEDLWTGRFSPRTQRHQQRFSGTLSLGLTDRQALNWIDLQQITYQSSFNWQNGAQGSITGASVQNSLTVSTGVSVHPNRVWERFGFFRRLKEAQSQSASGSSQEEGDDGGVSWSDIPLPNPVGMLRGLALMVLDINDITVNYNGDQSGSSSSVGRPKVTDGEITGVDVHYGLIDAFQGEGPSLGYRFGLDRSIDPHTERILREELQVTDSRQDGHRFEGSTTLSPSPSFQIDLNWDVEWSRQSNITFQGTSPGVNGGPDAPIERFRTETGDNTTSVWAFGSIGSFFERQVRRLEEYGNSRSVWDASNVALTNASLSSDFRDELLTARGSFGPNSVVPVPMPSWTVSYSGLSEWPLVRSIVESASIRHSYNATYQSSFSSVSTAGETTGFNVGNQMLQYRRPAFEIGSASISEQFQPLLGLDLSWTGNLQTSIEWSQQVDTYLRTSNNRVTKTMTSELSGELSYQSQGLLIPVLGLGRLENQIRLSLTLSHSINDELWYNLRPALEEAQSNDFTVDPNQVGNPENDYVDVREQTSRLQVTPKITYNLSNRVSADFVLEYEKFNGDNRQPSYTNINGGFNIRVNITQN